jgi:replicative DNA helicase
MQVIGAVYQNPTLLDNDNYSFNEEDFPNEFQSVIFGAIFNLHTLGAKEITVNTIEDYLQQRTTKFAVYKNNKGAEYLTKLKETTTFAAFDYYYHRMKKYTLLRMYHEHAGMDLSWLYDIDNILDLKKKEAQEEWLDNTSESEIADLINNKIEKIKSKYVENADDNFSDAGDGIVDLIDQLQQYPEIGYPLYGDLMNSIVRGARLKKFYLRSAETGLGKTRTMIADVCCLGCDRLYNREKGVWEEAGTQEPVLYITTEQELDEVQTMMLAFVSMVDESHIINNTYYEGELDRVLEAAKIIEKSPIFVKQLPDFGLLDIENAIKYGVHEHKVRYVFHDYIHSSMKILSEVSGKANVKGLREDNVLFMISVRLKDLANQYGIFLLSATQLSNEFHTAKVFDQGLLQGAKAIANKVDVGMIMLYATDEDQQALRELCEKNGLPVPDIKISVYKNRRGQYNRLFVWAVEDRGVCRITPIFATKYDYSLQDIPRLNITVVPREEESAF